jgi:hypothetical protein
VSEPDPPPPSDPARFVVGLQQAVAAAADLAVKIERPVPFMVIFDDRLTEGEVSNRRGVPVKIFTWHGQVRCAVRAVPTPPPERAP